MKPQDVAIFKILDIKGIFKIPDIKGIERLVVSVS